MKTSLTKSGNTTLHVLLAVLSLVALVLGIVALQSGATCKRSLEDLQLRLEDQTTRNGQIASDVQQLRGQVQAAFNTLGQEVLSLRDQIKNRTPAPTASTEPGKTMAKPAADAPAAPPSGPGTFHTIQAGDTFGRIAGQYGTTTEAIENLNPDASPTRLRIGQKIRVK